MLALLLSTTSVGAPAQDAAALRLPADVQSQPDWARALAAELLARAAAAGQPYPADPRFRLELLAGRPAQALQSIAERRRELGNPIALTAFEMYAQALSQADRLGFEAAFRAAFAARFAGLDNRQAGEVGYSLGTALWRLRQGLSQQLERQPPGSEVNEAALLPLLRAQLTLQAYERMQPLAEPLIADDEARRYVTETALRLPGAGAAQISALLVRPRQDQKLTSLLQFTIYADPRQALADARQMAMHGYAGVVAFTRGKGPGASGPVAPFEHDGADARAVIGWLAAQAWSDGRVGMFGSSYNSFAQWAAAKHRPPALQALATSASAAPGIDVPMEGQVFLNFMLPWPLYAASGPAMDDAGYGDQARWARLDRQWYAAGSAYREMDSLDGQPNPVWRRWLAHPGYDGYWQAMTPQGREFAAIDIPVLATTGYFDGGQLGVLHYFQQHRQHRPDANHRLLIGPYGHTAMQAGPAEVEAGYRIDPVARLSLSALRLQWFDHVFKGAPMPPLLQARVNYQVMGANVWKHADSLETMAARRLRLHLQADEQLQEQAPPPRPGALATLRVDFKDRSDADEPLPTLRLSRDFKLRHALGFRSALLPEGGEISGLFSGRLRFIANQRDLDFSVTVYEEMASGEVFELASWLQRASYARDRTRRQLLRPGRIEQIDFQAQRLVSRRLASGSRLLLAVGVPKQRDLQINLGSGKDVSLETLADARQPLRLQLLPGSWIELPWSP